MDHRTIIETLQDNLLDANKEIAELQETLRVEILGANKVANQCDKHLKTIQTLEEVNTELLQSYNRLWNRYLDK